jgi:hypothetical protein
MAAAAVLKKMSRILKTREVIREVQSSIEDLKRDQDFDVINALQDN